ncbi:neuroligin-4: Y-linked-like protein [Dinothrombium tinctorium]|uniref:Neuroligin-4: Y-linked-like protein n=1 Tax=Dinothrombium tinctorium TaxID=1965070 RepID=A0A3S3SEH0_9ACAR|nr:neuroligin-4: Y-linked-like protein [Dinothrombium tinctorium]
MIPLLTFLVLALTSLVAAYDGSETLSPRSVNTKYGSLRGIIESNSQQLKPVEVFLGVPYATPPIGSLRFMPPVTPAHWRGIKLANRFGPVCPQKIPESGGKSNAENQLPEGRVAYLKRIIPFLRNQSEDCLYLNIYSPFSQGKYAHFYFVLFSFHCLSVNRFYELNHQM